MPALDDLVAVISGGLDGNLDALAQRTEAGISGIFGERYRANSAFDKRVALMTADRNVPFAGLLHPDTPWPASVGLACR
jgi:hypothetical protein